MRGFGMFCLHRIEQKFASHTWFHSLSTLRTCASGSQAMGKALEVCRANTRCKKMLEKLEKKDLEGKGNALIRAQDIILELLYSLDQGLLDQGDELAMNLQRLYLYSYRRLIHANLRMDAEAVDEVIKLMENLLEAWEQIAAGDGGNNPASSSPGVALTG